ncbi:LacI family DNA-binding transcriptional regulator [Actinopolymorpha alba]|uniref:LacI family DNA-binding transcriptional regulator n=1 Tax=Actinopolymorpha alba TaxID=533267 RepID=UPI00036B416D|nr:GntR family transcriptional regulator [Actinopolymorpha alba]
MSDTGPLEPIYEQIKREIRATIARGDYIAGTPFITQREVCERYGVSTTTAVRALNDLVAEGALVRRRGKGTFVAEPTPRPASSGGPGSDDRSIACVVHGLQGPHVSRLVKGVESVCAELGYRMFLSDSDGSPEREERALQQAIATNATGVVLYPVEGHANGDLLEDLRRRRVPVVLADRYRTDLATDAVIVDNFTVGYQLTKELIDRGHRSIGTLWSETQCTSVRDRLTGHKHALREHDLPVLPELTVLRSFRDQPAATRRAVLSRLLGATEPPTVFLCSNGYVLAAAANALLELGVDIPGQVDLAGMDDAGPYDIIPLTAVAAALPSLDMGVRAMRLLAERIGSDDPYRDVQHIVLPAEIRTRESASAYLRAVSATPVQ